MILSNIDERIRRAVELKTLRCFGCMCAEEFANLECMDGILDKLFLYFISTTPVTTENL